MTNSSSSHGKVILKPPLKWPGGKRWLAPHFRRLFPFYKEHRWVEPFCGGLGLTLSLLPDEALLSDINPHLINFYIQIRKGLKLPVERFHNEAETYYKLRDAFNDLISSQKTQTKKAAWLFYYLNRTGFNGLCRFNKDGKFNVPFGRYKTINYRSEFSELKPLFRRWEFRCCHYEALTGDITEDDIVYADPPYDVEFTKYFQDGFTFRDQEHLADWLARLPARTVIISNQATDRICALYRKLGFTIEILDGPRRISCNGDRTPAREVLGWILKEGGATI